MFRFAKINNLNLLKNPISLFDVSLRDGLQSFPKILNINEKKELLDTIIDNKSVDHIEIGSIVSHKYIPQMKNSIDLYKYACTINNEFNYFMLIPNIKACKIAIDNNIQNFSFITSVSNEFQKKNINKTLHETNTDLKFMNDLVKTKFPESKIKIYVSCINHCPIQGKINNDYIIKEIINIKMENNYDYLCLSDTCGNLHYNDFKYIIENLQDKLDFSKISLHLHEQDDEENIKKIIYFAYKNNIHNFDISSFENMGGCNMTIDKPHANITSNMIYKSLFV